MKIKSFVSLLMVFALTVTIGVMTSAFEINQNVFEYLEPYVTIEFEENNAFEYEQKEAIADRLAGIIEMSEVETESTNNIICTLFGHNLSNGTVTATHHKAYIHDPRCKVEVYDVTACSRCDYAETVLKTYFSISCCPEDLIN